MATDMGIVAENQSRFFRVELHVVRTDCVDAGM